MTEAATLKGVCLAIQESLGTHSLSESITVLKKIKMARGSANKIISNEETPNTT